MGDKQPREMKTTHDELLEFPISTESLPRCLLVQTHINEPNCFIQQIET